MKRVCKNVVKNYLSLIKILQTILLLITGIAGFLSVYVHNIYVYDFFALVGSLLLSISGTTVLNMIYDRDIDSKMKRTENRPLPSGKLSVKQALIFALLLLAVGLSWAFSLDVLYGSVVFAGLLIDFVIYTIWLKRRTAWAIVFGGISGGMPILAGRVLALSEIDFIGVVLCLAILFWIPTHIMTFSIKYKNDYSKAIIPTFPAIYGEKNTRLIITFSSIVSALFIGISVVKIGLPSSHIYVLMVLSVALFGISVLSIYKPSEKLNLALFKYASVFMLLSMLLIMTARL